MSYKFISDDFDRQIYTNVVERMFPNLNNNHKRILYDYLYGTLQIIASCFEFYNNQNSFIIKLKQNNYKDPRWLLTFLLPYINTILKPMTEIKNLDELYALRYDKLTIEEKEKYKIGTIDDINITSPKYVFSNTQYGRFFRNSDDNKSSISIIKARKFQEKYIRDNYFLLLETIKRIRYKLYINWIDIIPYRLDNYKESILYEKTKNKYNEKKIIDWDPIIDYPLEKIRDDETIINLNKKIDGMNIGDIYNIISLELYEAVVQYKWLIFEVIIYENDNLINYPLIRVLNEIIDIKNCINDIEWLDVPKDERNNFQNNWDLLVDSFLKRKSMEIKKSTQLVILSSQTVEVVVKGFINFFDQKYRDMRIENYIKIDKTKVHEFEDNEEEEIMRGLPFELVMASVDSLMNSYNYIYEFIRESIQGFKNTWYSNYIMNNDKNEILKDVYYYKEFISGIGYVTFKNVYNFAKSMVHFQVDNENKRYPLTWWELDDFNKNEIINRLNDKYDDHKTWFNISKNIKFSNKEIIADIIRRSSGENLTSDGLETRINNMIDVIMKNIYVTIRYYFVNIIFEAMIFMGILSYMETNNEITNETLYDISNDTQKRNLIEKLSKQRFYPGNPYKKNSYYYLTNKPYENTGNFKIMFGKNITTFDFFKVLSAVDFAWYVAPAYHWISQIGFCHKFIHNRVNYITGATGAGKSTQVPKMYMYYLKALEGKNDGTVIITVPRTNVATNVSNHVSRELAVPYKSLDDNGKEHKKNNYYIQYKHMKDSHTKDGNFLKIRFITDGSVLQDAKDPLNKIKKPVSANIKIDGKMTRIEEYAYSRRNKYDVVIVDEAHEHNDKMDMILTMMRNATYYNNKLRFVIMSATMDADEPVYRRFYRDINDNRKYPLDNWIQKHGIDRINIDRRFHISSPDQTTRFKIDEYYIPSDTNDIDADTNNVINIVKDILAKSIIGDILVFQPGSGEIQQTVAKLNKHGVMPETVIAIPYHAQMPKLQQELAVGIDKRKDEIRLNKDQDFILTQDPTKGENKYSRVVLVATNIAEASISISTLKFVVDTGTEKTMTFDFDRRSNILIKNYITEANKLQRKGRVGRTSPGTVYYTYNKGFLENNKKQFSISVQDIHQSIMLDLIRDIDDKPVISSFVNKLVAGIEIDNKVDNKIDNNVDNDLDDLDNISSLITESYEDRSEQFVESIIDFIMDHYIVNGKLYRYYGDPESNDYIYNKYPPLLYFSGYDMTQLTDATGEFYIVHPDELVIKRNIAGDVIDADQYAVTTKSIPLNMISKITPVNKYKKIMVSKKILVFWETLLNKALVAIDKNKNVFKTKLGILLQKLMREISIFKDISLINILFFGYGLSKDDAEFEKIMDIVCFLNAITWNLKNIVNGPTWKDRIIQMKHISLIFNNNFSSDLYVIQNICTYIDDLILSENVDYNFLKSSFFKYQKYMDNDIIGIETGIPKGLDQDDNGLEKKETDIIRN